MADSTQCRRLLFLSLLLGACFAALGYRLVELQVFRHDELRELAQDNTQRSWLREPSRGDIRDARGHLLATSVKVKTVCVDPPLLEGRQVEVARVVAPLLKLSEGELLKQFSRLTFIKTNGVVATNHYVVLKRKVPVDDWEKIDLALAANFTNDLKRLAAAGGRSKPTGKQTLHARNVWRRAVQAEEDQLRVYPFRQLASQVIGFTGVMETNVNNRPLLQTIGAEGLEATFNSKLAGVRGWRVTELDSRRRELVAFREQDVAPRPGLNVLLTLDSRVQQIVEEELAAVVQKYTPVSAVAVVVRPATGAILAMATLPNFDPNDVTRSSPHTRRNRVITDVSEPGSTFKIVTAAGALNDNTVRLTDLFDCEQGSFFFAGRTLRDHEHYPTMSVEEIIAKSSNIGTAKIAIKMGEERVHQYIRDFGFGTRTRIPLFGESPGIVHPVKDWTKISISRISIGQGVAATPLQTVMAMSAIANGGQLMQPMLIDRLVDENDQVVTRYQPAVVRRVITESATRQTVAALKKVVNDGTGDKAALEHYTVAGKTGTAQKPGVGGYQAGKYYASFIGFFPADAPELCIAVLVDEPNVKVGYYGGQVAAPAFKRIAERAASYLNIRPDILPGRENDVIAGERLAPPVPPPIISINNRFN